MEFLKDNDLSWLVLGPPLPPHTPSALKEFDRCDANNTMEM